MNYRSFLVIKPKPRRQESLTPAMMETFPFLPGLSPVYGKELCARFDGGRLSSDGGVLLLREVEHGLGLAGRLASCLRDDRDPWCTTQSQADMIRARMFAIACGYEDCDDLDNRSPVQVNNHLAIWSGGGRSPVKSTVAAPLALTWP